jgi:hypothetical protein
VVIQPVPVAPAPRPSGQQQPHGPEVEL